jgi:hypothetical protein
VTGHDLDEMGVLERMRADLPDPPAPLAGVRAGLITAMAQQGPAVVPLRPRTRRLGWRLAAGAAAAVTVAAGVGALVAAGGHQPVVPGRTTTTVTTASSALDLAADKTTNHGDPTLAPGQYLRATTEAWQQEQADGVHFLARQRMETWVPANDEGTWYWRETDGLGTKFANTADEAKVRAHDPSYFTSSTTVSSGHHGRPDKATDGQPQPSTAPASPNWDFPTPAWLAQQPTDPDAMLAAIERSLPATQAGVRAKGDVPTLAFEKLGYTMATGFVPAAQRAALYRAATKIPGVTLVSAAATIDGHHGVAVGHVGPLGDVRDELIFDPTDGTFLGERQVVLKSAEGDGNMPVGSTYRSTSVTGDVTGDPHLL